MKVKLALPLWLLGVGLVSGCGGGNDAVTTVPTAHLEIVLPGGTANAGTPYTFTVTALDASNAVVTTYAGTVHVTTSDPSATPLADATLPRGSRQFTVTFSASDTHQTITAVDVAGNAVTGTTTVSVTTELDVKVAPEQVALSPGNTQAFTASVYPIDTGNRNVTWTIKEGAGGGTISTAGLYTAPATPGTYHVVASSVADPTFSATANVIVWPNGVITGATGSMANARGAYTATPLANGPASTNGKVLIVGGDEAIDPNTIVGIKGAELYDPSTGSFLPTGSMAEPRYAHTATLLPNGTVLVTGGLSDGGIIAGGTVQPPTMLSSAEIYDPAAATFTATGSMTTPRANHTATLLPNGKVLIVGGITGDAYGKFPYTGGSGVITAELYDPASGTFAATGSLTIGRYAHTATLLGNGTVLIAGGIVKSELADLGIATLTNTAELYDALTNSFAPTGSMHVVRAAHTATLLKGGSKVLVTGGRYLSSATAELYDSTTGTFAATGNLTAARFGHTATLTGNGDVLVAGGWLAGCSLFCPTAATTTLELYDASTASFSPVGAMKHARAAHAAVLLGSGEVLLAGGEDEDTAELYQ